MARSGTSRWRKITRGIAVLWGSYTLVFLMFAAVPDPARQLAGQQADPAVIADLRARLGLDQPLSIRYVRALADLSPVKRTDEGWTLQPPSLGDSFIQARSVNALWPMRCRPQACWPCGFVVGGEPWHPVSRQRRGCRFNRFFVGGSALGMSAPSFFMAVLWATCSPCAGDPGPDCPGRAPDLIPGRRFVGPPHFALWSHAPLAVLAN